MCFLGFPWFRDVILDVVLGLDPGPVISDGRTQTKLDLPERRAAVSMKLGGAPGRLRPALG
jgi:hypothetical protein